MSWAYANGLYIREDGGKWRLRRTELSAKPEFDDFPVGLLGRQRWIPFAIDAKTMLDQQWARSVLPIFLREIPIRTEEP